jgi:DNA topoisomerase IB
VVLARIRDLVIPPAWREVWICPDDKGHLQAVGVDAAGRRQYLYHEAWRAQRDAAKFVHMRQFAGGLSRLRRTVRGDLARRGLCPPRVLATGARLLDLVALRIGGEAYAQDDDVLGDATFGLATLRRDHVRVRGDRLWLCFPGKGSLEFERELTDAALAGVVRALLARPDGNEELLGYWTGRAWRDVHSGDINDYLRASSGADITAKDFRTWHATVAAALALSLAGEARSDTARRRAVAAAMRETADLLGNTPTVARKSYVDNRVVDLYRSGVMIDPPRGVASVADAFADRTVWARAERGVLRLLA